MSSNWILFIAMKRWLCVAGTIFTVLQSVKLALKKPKKHANCFITFYLKD